MTSSAFLPPRVVRWLATLIAVLLLGVVSPLEARAAEGSTVSLGATTVAPDGTLSVSYRTDRPATTNWIGIYRASQGAPGGGNPSYAWLYAPGASGTATFRLDERANGNGTPTASAFTPGDYRVEYLASDGYERLVADTATSAFTVATSAAPTITGTPAVGATLTVDPGTWDRPIAAFSYLWRADGVPVPGGTTKDLRVTPELLGTALTVEVTPADEATPVTATSKPFAIPTSTILLERATTAPSGTLDVTYATLSPGARNWIGFYTAAQDAPASGNPSFAWLYAPGASGTVTFRLDERANGDGSPSRGGFDAGQYRAEYLANDGYTRLVGADAAPVLGVTAGPTPGGFDPGLGVTDPIAVPDLGAPSAWKQKTLVIGIDGIRWDQVRAADTPNIARLLDDGTTAPSYTFAPASGDGAYSLAGTWSGPTWSSILTGVWPNKHGVTDNSFVGKNYDAFPDMLTRVERARPELTTFAATDWAPFGVDQDPMITDEIDYRYAIEAGGGNYYREDRRSADLTARVLYEDRPDASFIYMSAPDENTGGDVSGAQYRKALESTDRNIGAMLRAIEESPSYASEDWRVVLVNDHGLTDGGGHGGGGSATERTVYTAILDPRNPGQQRSDLKTVDIAATVLDRAGVAIDPAWSLDGVPYDTLQGDAFDTMRSSLKPRVDETDVPEGMRGWTNEMPAGWRVDNSAMPAGGVTEWRGWTLTTNEFWASPSDDRNQGRENFVLGRNVIAVADSDAWADRGLSAPGARFASTLVTPRYTALPGAQVDLSYVTQYQRDPQQTAEVSVLWSTGDSQVLEAYDQTYFGPESFTVTAPEGATGFEVRFAYSGSDSWFWALDQVRVAVAGGEMPGTGPGTAPGTDPGAGGGTAPGGTGAAGSGSDSLARTGSDAPIGTIAIVASMLMLLGAAALVVRAGVVHRSAVRRSASGSGR